MASVVDICNRGLHHIGAELITSFQDDTEEAKGCLLQYEGIRDEVLRDFRWNFATKNVLLALEAFETFTGFEYVYSYPTDCVNARFIVDPADPFADNKPDFKVFSSSDLTSKLIATNMENAELAYTARVTDPNMFDSQFINAFAYRLAAELAMPLRGSLELGAQMRASYSALLLSAQASNANEGEQDPSDDNQYFEDRL